MRAVYQRKQLHTFSLLSNLIGYLKRYCLQSACSHAFSFGGRYKPYFHWILPFEVINFFFPGRGRCHVVTDGVIPSMESVFQLLHLLKKGVIPDTYRVFKVLPSEPSLVIKLDALNTELQYHPAQGFRIQYLEPKGCKQSVLPLSFGGKLGLELLCKPTSPLHRERIECPATKGAEDILGEGLPRRESWRVGLC